MAGASSAGAGRGSRGALIVASTRYDDPGLRELRAPAADAQALAAALSDPDIGGFTVRTLLDEPAHVVNEAVEEFLTDRSPDDLLLLHFSCHGIKDQEGELYFAMPNTRLRLLAATAVAANFVNRRMTQSRSRRIVLFLDCCYAGAFERGMVSRGSPAMDVQERFTGRGRAVITASGALEYAFEDGRLTEASEPTPSVFTTAMVRGLTSGEADRDQDGYVDLDELYDYVYDAVRQVTPNQSPGKWTFGLQGDLVIARRRTPVTEPAPLPADLQQSLASPLPTVRVGAVAELAGLLGGTHQGRALAARRTLEALAADDDSRSVAAAASAVLAGARPATSTATSPATSFAAAVEEGQPGGAPPVQPPAAPEGGVPPEPTRPATQAGRSRARTPWSSATTGQRVLSSTLALVSLVAGGVLTWYLVGRDNPSATPRQQEPSTTIPASFDGRWTGTRERGVKFEATLGEGLHLGKLVSGASSCYAGVLRVTEATDSRLTTRFTPEPKDCNPWTVVFTPLSGGDVKMAVDPDSSLEYEPEFEIRMVRRG